jgi:hypothetical protein
VAVGVDGDHISFSATIGCVREEVTEVPPADRGSEEVGICASMLTGIKDGFADDTSDVPAAGKKSISQGY